MARWGTFWPELSPAHSEKGGGGGGGGGSSPLSLMLATPPSMCQSVRTKLSFHFCLHWPVQWDYAKRPNFWHFHDKIVK